MLYTKKIIIFIIVFHVFYSSAKSEMVARWSCDNSVGSSVLTEVVSSLNGTLIGSNINFTTSQAGISGGNFGNALVTNNLDDYVTLGDIDEIDFAKNNFSITGWFKTANHCRHARIIRHGWYDNGGFAVTINKYDGNLHFSVQSSDSNSSDANIKIESNQSVDDDNYHWFAGVVNNETLYLYIDGVLQDESGVVYASETTATANSGLITTINNDMAGTVDELCVYNTALTAELDGNVLIGGELYSDWYKIPFPSNCEQVWLTGHGNPADFNQDCKVDFSDLFAMAAQWLGTINTDIPLFWKKPVTFHNDVSGHGLEQLEGITNSYLYNPIASNACVDEGGDGYYESVLHGTYNHHPKIMVLNDKFIVTWTNHAKDENGPGQRLLVRVGTFNSTMDELDFGDDCENIIEVAPQPVLVDRRLYSHNPGEITGVFIQGKLLLINGNIYSNGTLLAAHGWTDEIEYSGKQYSPVPIEHWSIDYNSADGFTREVWWKLGEFYQRWEFNGDTFEPNTSMYVVGSFKTQVEVTPGNFTSVTNYLSPYNTAAELSTAPSDFKDDINNGTPVLFSRTAYFENSKQIAADGINGLAHIATFQKPDGKWVIIRDNTLNRGCYYAAMIDNYGDYCPPAYPTNLYGYANMDARELPDGRPYIICNSESRKDMFITISDDGYLFDETWLLLHSDRAKSDDGLFKSGGPQYFHSLVVDDNIWIVYSITKELIGLTKLPITLLN